MDARDELQGEHGWDPDDRHASDHREREHDGRGGDQRPGRSPADLAQAQLFGGHRSGDDGVIGALEGHAEVGGVGAFKGGLEDRRGDDDARGDERQVVDPVDGGDVVAHADPQGE